MRSTVILLLMLSSVENSPSLAGWVSQNTGTTRSLNDINANHGNINQAWACGDSGTIVYTSNGGTTWTRQSSGTSVRLYSIAFLEIGGGPVMTVGENGTILRTTNNGTTWTQIPSPTTRTLRCISDFGFHIVGDSGTILRSTDNGLTWLTVASSTTTRLNAVSGSGVRYAVGEQGIVVRQAGGQNPWEVFSAGTSDELFGTPMFSSANMAVGGAGSIFRSTSFGVSWYLQNSTTTRALHAVEYSGGNDDYIFCVGDAGTILKSTNNGAAWGHQASGTVQNLRGVFFYINDNNGWACGDSGTILKTTDGGGTFTNIQGQAPPIPESPILEQNYPNPFNPSTTIRFTLPHLEYVTLKILNLLGQEVATLVSGRMNATTHSVVWNSGNGSSGIYYYQLRAGDIMQTRKLIIIR